MPPVPMKSKDAAILKTARTLFLRHGIRRVSVEEVCREAGVSKRTFYSRFGNKDDLALKVLGVLIEDSRQLLEKTLDADIPIEEKVRRIIALKSKMAAEASMDFYREIMSDDSGPGRFARQKQREWDDRVRGFYANAQARGQIRSDMSVDFLMFLLVRIRDLMEDPELQRIEPDFSRLVESVMKLFFYGLVPRRDGAAAKTSHRKGGTHG
jgi:AcrR family transcriptional regulator